MRTAARVQRPAPPGFFRAWARWAWIWLACLGLSVGCRHGPPAFYPIGLYSVPGTRDDLASVRDAGFNVITGPADRTFLDAARAAGLKVLTTPNTTAGDRFDADAARRAVVAFDRHPAVWAWYLVDEPDLNQVPPEKVRQVQQFFKRLPAHKPTALVLYKGSDALDYGNIADLTMIDRYPIPWLPLANFGQHVRLTRLALGQHKPLVAVIQSFDWSAYPELAPPEFPLRAPTFAELRCMTYSALAMRADGLFYYAYRDRRWDLRQHPSSWDALRQVVREVNRRRPLFQAEHSWWPHQQDFPHWSNRFNAALESCVALARLRVSPGNVAVPAGDYLLAVNTTPLEQVHRFTPTPLLEGSIPVFEENRELPIKDGWVEDTLPPFAVRVYGPVTGLAQSP